MGRLAVGETECICDYKKGKSDRIYLENKLQLVAYTMAESAPMLGIVKTPMFRFLPVEITDRRPYEEMLKTLSRLWELKREIEA